MAKISETRSRILNFIQAFLEDRGYAPTVRDILKGCNITTSSVVQHHLNVLEKQGYIQRDPQVFRSIRLVAKRAIAPRAVPLLGTIAAGAPIPVPTPDTWATLATETVPLPDELVGKGENIYALRVSGTSMIDAFIDDGDIVLMQATSAVDDGDMAAIWLKEQQEVTLKRVYREGKRVRLQPANRQMPPIYHDARNVEIQGKVVGVIRVLGAKPIS